MDINDKLLQLINIDTLDGYGIQYSDAKSFPHNRIAFLNRQQEAKKNQKHLGRAWIAEYNRQILFRPFFIFQNTYPHSCNQTPPSKARSV